MQRKFLKQGLYPNKADFLNEHKIISATEQIIVNAQYKNNQFFCKHQHDYKFIFNLLWEENEVSHLPEEFLGVHNFWNWRAAPHRKLWRSKALVWQQPARSENDSDLWRFTDELRPRTHSFTQENKKGTETHRDGVWRHDDQS